MKRAKLSFVVAASSAIITLCRFLSISGQSFCDKWKDRSGFCKDRTRKDGLACWCKLCVADYHKRTGFVEKVKIYYRNHIEEQRKYHREYNQAHAEELKKHYQEYCRRPDVKKRSNWRWMNKYHKKRANGGSISRKEWIALCKKYGDKCLCCGRTDIKLTLDHVIPIDKGGRHSIENAQPLCVSCNSSKGTKIIDYRPF